MTFADNYFSSFGKGCQIIAPSLPSLCAPDEIVYSCTRICSEISLWGQPFNQDIPPVKSQEVNLLKSAVYTMLKFISRHDFVGIKPHQREVGIQTTGTAPLFSYFFIDFPVLTWSPIEYDQTRSSQNKKRKKKFKSTKNIPVWWQWSPVCSWVQPREGCCPVCPPCSDQRPFHRVCQPQFPAGDEWQSEDTSHSLEFCEMIIIIISISIQLMNRYNKIKQRVLTLSM